MLEHPTAYVCERGHASYIVVSPTIAPDACLKLVLLRPCTLVACSHDTLACSHALLTCSPFGSHVLEALLRALVATGAVHAPAAHELLETVVRLVKDDLGDYITDKHGTFLARSLLALLTGTLPAHKPAADEPPASAGLADKIERVQSLSGMRVIGAHVVRGGPHDASASGELGAEEQEQHAALMRAFAHTLLGPALDSETLVTLQRSTAASPFLQAMLKALDGTELAEPFLLRMLGAEADAGSSEPTVAALVRLKAPKLVAQLKNKASSHLFEALLLRTPAAAYEHVWALLKPGFANLCLNPVANFTAQAFIAAAPAARFVTDIVVTLRSSIADALQNRRSGVVCVLAVACACWRASCDDLCVALAEALPDGVRFGTCNLTLYQEAWHYLLKPIETNASFCRSCPDLHALKAVYVQVLTGLAMLDQESDFDSAAATESRRPPRMSVPGCILLQAVLSMPQTACKHVTDALVALPEDALKYVAQDASGTRVVEAFLKVRISASICHPPTASVPATARATLHLTDHLDGLGPMPSWLQLSRLPTPGLLGGVATMSATPSSRLLTNAPLQGSTPKQLKKGLIRKLAPAYARLAALPAPSRLVEALYLWGDAADKEVIVAALAADVRGLLVRRCAVLWLAPACVCAS
jgi:hypothetical protein